MGLKRLLLRYFPPGAGLGLAGCCRGAGVGPVSAERVCARGERRFPAECSVSAGPERVVHVRRWHRGVGAAAAPAPRSLGRTRTVRKFFQVIPFSGKRRGGRVLRAAVSQREVARCASRWSSGRPWRSAGSRQRELLSHSAGRVNCSECLQYGLLEKSAGEITQKIPNQTQKAS